MTNCKACRHFLEEFFEPDGEKKGKCRAYKTEIPPDLFHGFKEHLLPYQGDNGFRFVEDEKRR